MTVDWGRCINRQEAMRRSQRILELIGWDSLADVKSEEYFTLFVPAPAHGGASATSYVSVFAGLLHVVRTQVCVKDHRTIASF